MDAFQFRISQPQRTVQWLGDALHYPKSLGADLALGRGRGGCRHIHTDETFEEDPTIGTAEQRRHRAFRVGHETNDIARLVRHTGDVVARAIGVVLVAQHDLAIGNECVVRRVVTGVRTREVIDGHDELLAGRGVSGEHR